MKPLTLPHRTATAPLCCLQILEGYGFLGNTGSLGEVVNSCFVGVINASALKVVRGIILTRAGLEERARSHTILQEIVKCLPPDLYRQCLARVSPVLPPPLPPASSPR